jgi:hypothetical protein
LELFHLNPAWHSAARLLNSAAVNAWIQQLESTGTYAPWCFLGVFIAASLLMIWRLEAMSDGGFESTVLGTLIMPYCSGIGNLIFAFLLGRQNGPGEEVMTNALVNNITNLTLLIGLPAILWQAKTKSAPKEKPGKGENASSSPEQLHRLSMLLTLLAVFPFNSSFNSVSRNARTCSQTAPISDYAMTRLSAKQRLCAIFLNVFSRTQVQPCRTGPR